jgi:protein tyrosine phosphatase (PTP) superfamily phosphohydrolase (DUF442 family)
MRMPLAVLFFSIQVGCATSPPPAASAPQSPNPQASAVAADKQPPQQPAVVAIPNVQNPLPGVVTGGQPSEDNLRQAKALGYHTVISLLPEADSAAEAESVRKLGMRFVSIPISGAADLGLANAQKLAAAMDAGDSKPLILHCGGGNRAGALLALKVFYVDHASAEDALALGERAGLRSLKSAIEDRMRAAAP